MEDIKKLSHYEKYKELIKKNNSKKFTCECGSITRNDKKYKHLKSKKHINFELKNQGLIHI